jgi:MHS family proline/betaine transporter-like MFS transporter
MSITKNVRDKIAVALGSSLDWYDFALYGFFATIFAKMFFPGSFNQAHALIYTFGMWFIGFAARPLGAVILAI